MTQARATNRRTRLEKNAADVMALLVAGKTQAEVARQYGVHYSSVMRFVDRHAAELEELRQKVAAEVADFAIAQKVNRIAALDDRWQRMKALINARASDTRYSDEPGYDTGLMVHQLKAVGKGEDFQLVDLYVTDSGLLAEMRATEHAAAEELAQLPRPSVEISDRRTYVLQVITSGNGDTPLG